MGTCPPVPVAGPLFHFYHEFVELQIEEFDLEMEVFDLLTENVLAPLQERRGVSRLLVIGDGEALVASAASTSFTTQFESWRSVHAIRVYESAFHGPEAHAASDLSFWGPPVEVEAARFGWVQRPRLLWLRGPVGACSLPAVSLPPGIEER